MSNPIVIDFETFYSRKLKYTLKTSIAETYCQSHLFDPYLLAVSDGSQEWVGNPKDFPWEALNGRDLVAHNSYFEQSVVAELIARKWIPNFTPRSWTCTANMTSYLTNNRSLELGVEALFGVRVDKSAREEMEGKRWADLTPEKQQIMAKYALGDVRWAGRILAEHGHRWPTVERELSRITINQGLRGVQINVELLENFIIWTHEMKTNTENVIPWIRDAEDESWDDFNTKPTATKCIAEQCRREGIPCPPVKSEDEEGYEEWEKLYSPNRPWIIALGAWRSINKLYKTFLTMKSRLRPDGTMPFALLYFGAHTGRWSATAKVNFQNQRKEPIFCNEFGLMEQNMKRIAAAMQCKYEEGKWPDWVRYSIDFRHLIMPRPGKKMITSDLSQIEPRVLAWLVGDSSMLNYVASGMSPYEAHARTTMKWTGGDLKSGDKKLYALAKARVLALGYGAGWEKFVAMAALYGIDVCADDPEFVEQHDPFSGITKKVSGYGTTSKAIVKAFRESNPKITGLWKMLDESMKSSVGGDFTMSLPSGRKMKYVKVRGERRIEPDPETKLPKSRTVYTVQIGHKRVITYGGKLAENLVQASARDVFGEHLVAMDRNGWDNLFSVHDEAILEVDKSVTAKDVEHEMSKCPEWLPGCPISAEAKEVAHYEK